MAMRDGLKKAGLVGLGTVLGLLLSLNLSVFAQRESRLPIPYEDLQLLSAVFGKIKSDYVEPVSDDKLIKEAINGMVHGLDPHSDFLDADAFKELQVSTQGKFGGLGIEVGVEDGVVRVISPIEDTPAFRAGIKAGDLIIKIDDLVTRGMPLSKAVDKMRGKPGTNVILTVVRKDAESPLNFTLTREEINVKSVRYKSPEPGYGYIRIRQFQDHKRATVMGAQTFGKGSVQPILPLGNNAGLKLTTARYYTPSGRSIQAKGIEPDVLVDDGRESANRIREANLEHHLDTAKTLDKTIRNAPAEKIGNAPPGASADQSIATPVKPPLPATPDGVQAAPPPPRIDFGSDEDFQLKQALNQLKGSPVITSTKALQAQASQTQAVPTKP